MYDPQQQLEQCPECDGEGETATTYGDRLYTSGYSDHGYSVWEVCPFCNGTKHCTSDQLADWLGIDMADFAPLPEYNQSRVSNRTYTNVTTTRIGSDGSITQSIQLLSKKWTQKQESFYPKN